jgi:hypothetical protein
MTTRRILHATRTDELNAAEVERFLRESATPRSDVRVSLAGRTCALCGETVMQFVRWPGLDPDDPQAPVLCLDCDGMRYAAIPEPE